MTGRLPPLHLLRTFETAARLLSFKLAAEELHVTPSAVSHQMRQLEDFLGIPLFLRVNRGLQLTDAGRQYQNEVADALRRLARSTHELHRHYGRPVVRASILPLMAAELVIPALESFHHRHPDIELRIETSVQIADFTSGELDVAIRYGLGAWPGLISEKICGVVGTPVCSPAYAREKRLHSLEDLRRCNLIGLPLEHRAWEMLGEIAGLEDFHPEYSLSLDSLLATCRAAEQGLGLAVGVFPLMSPLVEAGRLVTPFPIWAPVAEGYHLVWRPEDTDRPPLVAFRRWIQELFTGLSLPAGASDERSSSEAELLSFVDASSRP